jgi:transcriptional regulator GlxA family with amidase domain
MTPSQLIVQTRLSAASRMLKETTLPISDIALSCGFYDHSALTRSFHAMTGMTPSEVRRSEQKVFAYGS